MAELAARAHACDMLPVLCRSQKCHSLDSRTQCVPTVFRDFFCGISFPTGKLQHQCLLVCPLVHISLPSSVPASVLGSASVSAAVSAAFNVAISVAFGAAIIVCGR